MLTLQIPTLLALLGTALMAVVIFAPVPVPAKLTMSFAPPLPLPPLEQWNAARTDPFAAPPLDEMPFNGLPPASQRCTGFAAAGETAPTWPVLIEPRAAGCDASARLGLVDALAAVRAPWADAILRRALDDEPDAGVRDAVVTALRHAGER